MSSRSTLRPAAVRARVTWGDWVLFDELLAPPRPLSVGTHDEDVVVPESLLTGRAVPWLCVDDAGGVRARVLHGEDAFELREGARHVQTLGDLTFELMGEAAVARAPRALGSRRMSAYFVASAALCGAALGALAASPSQSVEEIELDRIALMQQYLKSTTLSAAAEREEDEGGMGTRAKGETGSMGRFAVQGPGADPQVVRQAALREAAEFGMIGVLNAGASGDPALGSSGAAHGDAPLNARGSLWGAGVGDAKGAGGEATSGEDYGDDLGINAPTDPKQDAESTFAVDVDTGAYNILKKKIEGGALPPLHAIRAEELINAFDYGYPGPSGDDPLPFAATVDAAPSPFDAEHHFVRVAVQGRHVPKTARPPVHLVYLVDTSGSMQSADKLELAKTSLALLTRELRPTDTVALVTYAGDVREVLSPTRADRRDVILKAIDDLSAAGSTAMGSGLELAYRMAAATKQPGHISRVVVLSDGDANVGETRHGGMLQSIEYYRRQGVTLSTVGFGQGNYKDHTMEQLANAGDGNYSYVGSERDARRVFVQQVEGLLHVIAKDVKVQVHFDPSAVQSYRLVGYENRDVADQDFRNDSVDGGEIGSGHAVTALYEVRLRHRLQTPVTVKLRYKAPEGSDAADEIAVHLTADRIGARFDDMPSNFRFAVAVAGAAEILRGSPYAERWTLSQVRRIAAGATDGDAERRAFVGLVESAAEIRGDALALAR